jgi:hypothetical protein
MKGEGQRNPPRTGDSASLESSGERRIDREQATAERGSLTTQPQAGLAERDINMDSDNSFPASDPPSWSPTTAGSPCPDGSNDCEE